jgi:tRNA1(Val) A37 N6-methylase TrmN6
MGLSLSSAAHARPSAATARAVRDSRAESAPAPTSGKALPKRAAASTDAVGAFVRKRAEEFLNGGSEEHVSPSLRRLVRAQNKSLEESLDRETRSSTLAGTANAEVDEKTPQTHPFPDETLDVLFRRRLLLLQARKGYRCNVDSLLLAAHAAEVLRRRVSGKKCEEKPPRVADLGAGSGVVGFAVALDLRVADTTEADTDPHDSTDDKADGITDRTTRVLSIERQASLASRCARNAALNGLGDRVTVWRGDVNDVVGAAETRASEGKEKEKEETRAVLAPWLRTCDAVVVNPPYYELDSKRAAGTQPRETERRDAHYETTATLLDFARAAEALLSPEEGDEANGGEQTKTPPPTAHFVYPADRAAAVAAACAAAGLGDVTIKRVFTDERVRASNGDPALALIDARRALRAERDPERDPERRRIEARRADASGVLYADDARRTYGADVETFMENLGL